MQVVKLLTVAVKETVYVPEAEKVKPEFVVVAVLGALNDQVAVGVTAQLYAYVVGKHALAITAVVFVAATTNAGG